MQEEGELVGEQGVLLVPCRADAVAACGRAASFAGCHTGTRGSFMPAVSKTAGYGVPSRTWR